MIIVMLRIAQKSKKHSFHKVNPALAYDMFSANVLPLLTLP